MFDGNEPVLSGSNDTAVGSVGDLQRRMEQGNLELRFEPRSGYLRSLLEALQVPLPSQMLVFSKTFFQQSRISPQTPRAIYFSDRAYVSWIPGAPMIELSLPDPKSGAVFYTLDQRETPAPKFIRRDQCLECHTSIQTLGVPGYLVRSFVTDEKGVIDLDRGISMVDHRTPFSKRWGGWYVSGTHGSQTHWGNLFGPAAFLRQETEPNYRGNLTNLNGFFETSQYLQPQSDIVALLVFEHQCQMQNLFARLQHESTKALSRSNDITPLKADADALLKYLLFTDEAPLRSPVRGVSDFAKGFESQGPKDRRGRSLRQFDLQTRLFKYPCSYLIYTEAFDSLPREVKLHLYRRLWKILHGEDDDPQFQKIDAPSRQAILEILSETKSGLPVYWTM